VGPLNDAEVVARISKWFVPVALNADRFGKDDESAFFRKLMDRWPQGLWVVGTDGTTHAFTYHKPDAKLNFEKNQKKWIDDTKAMLDDGWKAAGKPKDRDAKIVDPFPDRGLGYGKDGGLRLDVTVVGLRNGKPDTPPAIDSVLLSKDDAAAFFQPGGKESWTIPEATAKQFHKAMTFITDSIYVPLQKDIQKAEVKATVLKSTDDAIVVRLDGTWEAKFFREGNEKFPLSSSMTGRGILELDPTTKKPKNLIVLLDGQYGHGDRKTPMVGVVEWIEAKPTEKK